MDLNSIKELSANQRGLLNLMCDETLTLEEAMLRLGVGRRIVTRWLRNAGMRARLNRIGQHGGWLGSLEFQMLFQRSLKKLGRMLVGEEKLELDRALLCLAIVQAYLSRKRKPRRKPRELGGAIDFGYDTGVPEEEQVELLERIRKSYEEHLKQGAREVS